MPGSTETPLITLVFPAYNEEKNLPLLFERIGAVVEKLPAYRFEMLILDNFSSDRTPEIATAQCRKDTRWKYVRYSRNFGVEASMLAGLDLAEGDAVITIFSDMQDPPEYIPTMLEKWREGNEVVYGIVKERNDSSFLKTLGAKMAYKLIRALAECDIPENATDFRLLDRKVVLNLRTMRESDRYMRGLVHWVGFRQTGFEYSRAKREGGKSSANLIYCIKFALHAIVCFSSKPTHLSMMFGLVLTTLSIVLAFLYTILNFVRPSFLVPPPPGLTTLILLLLFVMGSNALFLGIIGEYIGRIYRQGKGRPIYIIDRRENI